MSHRTLLPLLVAASAAVAAGALAGADALASGRQGASAAVDSATQRVGAPDVTDRHTTHHAAQVTAEERATALLQEFAQGWKLERATALRDLLGPAEIRFRLEPPGGDDGSGGGEAGDAPSYSASQVFYMLQEHFAAVRVTDARIERRVAATEPNQAHGVLDVEWTAASDSASTPARLFVGMRRFGEDWRVIEVRALP